MEKLLIIAEKPSAARNFQTALGGSSGTFEGDMYVIVNLYGHVLAHEAPEKTAYPQYKGTVGGFSNLDNLPWDYRWFDFDKKVPSGRDEGPGQRQAASPSSRPTLTPWERETSWYPKS